jgi:hypothetical protein
MYDVTFNPDDGDASPRFEGDREHIRRFYSESELAQFLSRHLNHTAEKAIKIVRQVRREGCARISGIEAEDWKLRGLNLAA